MAHVCSFAAPAPPMFPLCTPQGSETNLDTLFVSPNAAEPRNKKRKRTAGAGLSLGDALSAWNWTQAPINVGNGCISAKAMLVRRVMPGPEFDPRAIGSIINGPVPNQPLSLTSVPSTASMGVLLNLSIARCILSDAYSVPCEATLVCIDQDGGIQQQPVPAWAFDMAREMLKAVNPSLS
mgnify:CR=1 FL=1